VVLSRRDNPWVREHSKKSQTPTIVKKWKDSFPAPLAVLLFHECDIIKIEAAYHCDFIVLKVENGGLTETWIAFVYAYLEVTRQLEGYVCVCVCVNSTSGGERSLTTPAYQGRLALVFLPLGAAVNKIKSATLTLPNA